MTTYADAPGNTPSVRHRPLSPDQVRRPALQRTPLGRRGYDENDVHALLNRVAAELEGVLSEQSKLRNENLRLKDAMRQWHDRQSQSPAARMEVEVRHSAVQLMNQAQREADRMIAEAQNYARAMVEHARAQHDDILREGYQQAQLAAELAARRYRSEAGTGYRADVEELQRHLTWATTFLAAIDSAEGMLRAARMGLSNELHRIRQEQQIDM
jgi:DivIVA domain-containing protein